MAEVDAEGGLEKYARKTQTLVQLRGTKGTEFELSERQYAENEKEIKRRRKVAEEYEKQAGELIRLNASIEQFSSAIEAAKQAAEDARQKLAGEGALAEEAEIAGMTELGMRIEAGRKGLRQYDLLERDKDRIFYKSQSGLQSGLDRAQQAALEARARYESRLDEAERAPDSTLRAGLLEDAQEAMREWQFQQSRADTLNEAIRDLKANDLQEILGKLAAPDMSSTNSLASAGLMVNRSDDSARLESMNSYEQTQVELQRQIKDILETKSFAATAG